MFACESIRREDYHSIINKKINSSKFKFVEYDVKPLSKKSGIFGEHYFLKIIIAKNDGEREELSYFLKTLPQAESQKQFTLESGAFFKEDQFFKVFIPLFAEYGIACDCAPKYYFSQPDHLIIFEDLATKGFKCLNPRQSYDLDLVKMVIRTMVKLHSSCLILEEKLSEQSKSVWRMNEIHSKEYQEMLYCNKPTSLALLESCKNGTAGQIDFLLGPDLNDLKDFSRRCFDNFLQFVQPSKQHRNTICHGDLWAANIMFKFKKNTPTNCNFVDYQTYRYCPPAQDLLTFLYLATDRAFRAKHYTEVIEYYFEELQGSLGEFKHIISYEEFLQSCESSKLFAVVQSVSHFQIVMMSPEGMAEFLSDPEANRKCMFEDRSEVIIGMCAKDPFYKMKQIESVTDLRELFETKYQHRSTD